MSDVNPYTGCLTKIALGAGALLDDDVRTCLLISESMITASYQRGIDDAAAGRPACIKNRLEDQDEEVLVLLDGACQAAYRKGYAAETVGQER